MLSKVKQMLGIEGVVASLELPEFFSEENELLMGKIVLTSKSKQQVNSILIRFIERFSRGKKSTQRIDEYVVGQVFLNKPFVMESGETKSIDFELAYKIVKSEMDHLEDMNFLYKGLVKFAKFMNKVKSEYRISAEVDVKGTHLNPVVNGTIISK